MSARILPALLLLATSTFASAAPQLSETIPDGAFAYLEADGLADFIGDLRTSEFATAVWDSPEYKELQTQDGFKKLQSARKFAEFILGMNLWEAGEKLFGGQMGVALYPKAGEKDPDALLVVRPASRLAYMRQRLWLDPLFMVAGKKVLEGPLFETAGVKAWQTKGDKGKPAFVLLSTQWFAVSTDKKLLERAVTLGGDNAALAAQPGFRNAIAELGEDKLVRAYIDTAMISKATGGRLGIPEKAKQGFNSFVAGGITELVARGSYACFGLGTSENSTLVLEVVGDGDPAKLPGHFQVYFPHPPATGSRPIPQVPGMIGGVSIYRDLAAWYRGREDHLQAQVLPAFDKFETGIGNILPGHDIGEDVLPLFGSNFTFLSALQSYDHLEGKPGVQLPGFAIIASLEDPEKGTEMLQLVFQTFLSVLNLQAAEQKRQPWLIAIEDHAGTPITYARYLQTPSGDDLPTVFNFRPASARVGDEFVFSSSLGLCRSLVDALSAADRSAVAAEDIRIALDAAGVVRILAANRKHLEAAQVGKGRDATQAGADIDRLLALLERLEGVQLTTSSNSKGFKIRLEASARPAPKADQPAAPDNAPPTP